MSIAIAFKAIEQPLGMYQQVRDAAMSTLTKQVLLQQWTLMLLLTDVTLVGLQILQHLGNWFFGLGGGLERVTLPRDATERPARTI